MFWGLTLANLIDLDHIYFRLIGRVPWMSSACDHFGTNCSLGFYPLHSTSLAWVFLILVIPIIPLSVVKYTQPKSTWKRLALRYDKVLFLSWLGIGVLLHLSLDYLHLLLGFGI